MEPREYFKAVASELRAVRLPEEVPDMEEFINYIWNLWERNIAPEIAAELVVRKYGVGKEKYLS